LFFEILYRRFGGVTHRREEVRKARRGGRSVIWRIDPASGGWRLWGAGGAQVPRKLVRGGSGKPGSTSGGDHPKGLNPKGGSLDPWGRQRCRGESGSGARAKAWKPGLRGTDAMLSPVSQPRGDQRHAGSVKSRDVTTSCWGLNLRRGKSRGCQLGERNEQG
jgi:hypothetical protein